MMSSLFCLVIFLSLHACIARPFGFSDKETHTQLLFSGKDVKSSSIAEEIKPQEKLWAKMDESIIHEGLSVENAMLKRKDIKAIIQIKEDNKKGNKVVIEISPHQSFQQTATETLMKRQARSTLQKSTPHTAEETVDPKENNLPEDVDVMDYAQPHRKPPIHNMEP